MDRRHRLGREGEDRAAAYLEAAGYRIVQRNVRIEGVEVDLIARRGGTAVFVEVKTRRSRRLGAPEEAVDGRRQARLVRAAAGWLRSHGRGVRALRFDVITCEPAAGGGFRVRHLPAAFRADAHPG